MSAAGLMNAEEIAKVAAQMRYPVRVSYARGHVWPEGSTPDAEGDYHGPHDATTVAAAQPWSEVCGDLPDYLTRVTLPGLLDQGIPALTKGGTERVRVEFLNQRNVSIKMGAALPGAQPHQARYDWIMVYP